MTQFRFALAITAILASAGPALANAQIESAAGRVLVNMGRGFVPAKPGMHLAPGMRVMVVGAKGSKAMVRLSFNDGCSLPVKPGQVVTIGTQSPCAAQTNSELRLNQQPASEVLQPASQTVPGVLSNTAQWAGLAFSAVVATTIVVSGVKSQLTP